MHFSRFEIELRGSAPVSYLIELLCGFTDAGSAEPVTDHIALGRRVQLETDPYERGRALSQLATLTARKLRGEPETEIAPRTRAAGSPPPH